MATPCTPNEVFNYYESDGPVTAEVRRIGELILTNKPGQRTSEVWDSQYQAFRIVMPGGDVEFLRAVVGKFREVGWIAELDLSTRNKEGALQPVLSLQYRRLRNSTIV